jgi:hypothetical protein
MSINRRKAVLSVTITLDCATALNDFVEAENKAGWSTNKSQIVNNAIMEFIARNRERANAIPSSYKDVTATAQGKSNGKAT